MANKNQAGTNVGCFLISAFAAITSAFDAFQILVFIVLGISWVILQMFVDTGTPKVMYAVVAFMTLFYFWRMN